MAIIRYNPYSAMPRIFSPDALWDEDLAPDLTMTDGLDVWEENNKVYVQAAVPGIPADKVDVTYEDGVVHIKAKTDSTEKNKKQGKVVYRQDRVASFDYTTTLPRPVDPKSLEANVENGCVVVQGKISEAAQPKKISVKSASKKS